MPRKSRQIVCRVVITKIIEQQKRIEILGFAKAEGALQPDASAFDGGLGFNDPLDGTE